MTDVFFKDFLQISDWRTVMFIVLLIITFGIMHVMSKKKVSFGSKVLIAMVLGLGIGILIQVIAGFPDKPSDIVFVSQTNSWYSLFGNGFMRLIQMLVIPLVLVSIIHVIINMKEGANIGKLVSNTIVVTLAMTAVAAIVGVALGILFNVGSGASLATTSTFEIKEVTPIATTLRNLIPANPVAAMNEMNVIGIVIFAMFIGIGAKRMHSRPKNTAIIQPFYDFTNALHKIIISIAMTIIKLMPYAVIPLIANTIAYRGLQSLIDVGIFILVLYLAIAVMFVIQVLLLSVHGINPIHYLKKGLHVFVLAFTSRSSVGTLPVTIKSLTDDLGVNESTASFVASFGTTAGMQGCAGVFPSLLLVYVAHVNGTPIDLTFIVMAIIVVTIGSLGIAGIPGTATMAASVSLSGMGMGALYPLISPILAIDPLIDMGRTLLNVTGSMVNAIVVDKRLGTFDKEAYQSLEMHVKEDSE